MSYGRDIACGLDVDWAREVEGAELVRLALLRRFTTRKGQLIDDPEYGRDVRSFFGEGVTEQELAIAPALLAAEARKDDRVADVEVTLAEVTAQQLTVEMEGRLRDGSAFRLVLGVDELEVRDLTGGVA